MKNERNPQNIFDNPVFFEGYKALRARDDNSNVLIEQPEMKKLLPDLAGKSVLDLGCGYGHNCVDFVSRGASKVVGLDLSEKMLEVASAESSHEKITYHQMDMSDIDRLNESFDFIYSSLAFHYIEDFDDFAHKLYTCLNDGGELLFSQEHPLNTAGDSSFDLDENGKPVAFNLQNYSIPGKRRYNWFVDGIEKFHRTMSGILNPLMNAGFIIEKLVEPTPTDEALAKRSSFINHFIRPCFLIVKARKK